MVTGISKLHINLLPTFYKYCPTWQQIGFAVGGNLSFCSFLLPSLATVHQVWVFMNLNSWTWGLWQQGMVDTTNRLETNYLLGRIMPNNCRAKTAKSWQHPLFYLQRMAFLVKEASSQMGKKSMKEAVETSTWRDPKTDGRCNVFLTASIFK